MAAILKLKNIFTTQKVKPQSYRNHHFLNTLSQERQNELLLFSESEQIAKQLPDLKKKRVLFFYDGKHKFIYRKILNQQPDYCLSYFYGDEAVQAQDLSSFFVRGGLNRLPLKRNYFDVLVCPFALEAKYINNNFLATLVSLLRNGGRIILSLRHPQLEHIIFNQNPSATTLADATVSGYFNTLKNNSVYTEDMTEGCVGLSLRGFFTSQDETDYYAEYKNTPLTVLFKGVRFIKTKA